MFLALGMSELSKFTGVLALVGLVAGTMLVGILVYATLAFHNVYGGSLGMTSAKEAAIGALYGATYVVGFALIIYWVSPAG